MIGVGAVGSHLGQAIAEAGHDVVYGVRDPDADRHHELLATSPGARTARPPSSVDGADVAVLAVPWGVAPDVVRTLGDLGDTVLADATNPLRPGFRFDDEARPSGAHVLQEAATGGHLVKAFNAAGKENMADPAYPEGPAAMPLCGDDPAARERVAELCRTIGFEPLDCGDLGSASALEHLAWLWIRLAIPLGSGRDVAWRLARR